MQSACTWPQALGSSPPGPAKPHKPGWSQASSRQPPTRQTQRRLQAWVTDTARRPALLRQALLTRPAWGFRSPLATPSNVSALHQKRCPVAPGGHRDSRQDMDRPPQGSEWGQSMGPQSCTCQTPGSAPPASGRNRGPEACSGHKGWHRCAKAPRTAGGSATQPTAGGDGGLWNHLDLQSQAQGAHGLCRRPIPTQVLSQVVGRPWRLFKGVREQSDNLQPQKGC